MTSYRKIFCNKLKPEKDLFEIIFFFFLDYIFLKKSILKQRSYNTTIIQFFKEMKNFFSELKLPELKTLNWFQNHKTKVIENRKLLIENFLQKVLSSEVVIKSDKK